MFGWLFQISKKMDEVVWKKSNNITETYFSGKLIAVILASKFLFVSDAIFHCLQHHSTISENVPGAIFICLNHHSTHYFRNVPGTTFLLQNEKPSENKPCCLGFASKLDMCW